MVLQSPSSRVASDLLSLNRLMSSRVIGLITGHGHLRKRLHTVGILQEGPLCGMCDEQNETAEHLLFVCPSIARERYAIFGSFDKSGEFLQEDLIGCFRQSVELLISKTGRPHGCASGVHKRPLRPSISKIRLEPLFFGSKNTKTL
ncbi:hypothetical protein J6590_015056 [Homalodisca vitripennis]|nr:hypothetical protein J6590_015056 [Homalodisca vitripennis]